jgi:hypothetical protein
MLRMHRNALHDPHIPLDAKIEVRCNLPGVLFVEFILVPPEQENESDHISHLGCSRMQYVTHRSHVMQKRKFGLMCPTALLVETTSGPPKHE